MPSSAWPTTPSSSTSDGAASSTRTRSTRRSSNGKSSAPASTSWTTSRPPAPRYWSATTSSSRLTQRGTPRTPTRISTRSSPATSGACCRARSRRTPSSRRAGEFGLRALGRRVLTPTPRENSDVPVDDRLRRGRLLLPAVPLLVDVALAVDELLRTGLLEAAPGPRPGFVEPLDDVFPGFVPREADHLVPRDQREHAVVVTARNAAFLVDRLDRVVGRRADPLLALLGREQFEHVVALADAVHPAQLGERGGVQAAPAPVDGLPERRLGPRLGGEDGEHVGVGFLDGLPVGPREPAARLVEIVGRPTAWTGVPEVRHNTRCYARRIKRMPIAHRGARTRPSADWHVLRTNRAFYR